MSVNLATMLREGTKKSHTMAENVGFVKCFLKGVVEKNSYRTLVANLYFVYTAMEEEMENLRHDEIVSKIYFPELNRQQSLEKDLSFYYGANWRNEVAPSVAAQAEPSGPPTRDTPQSACRSATVSVPPPSP